MAYEVDYIAVGDGEKSGDAIALRFGNLTGPRTEQSVIVIDGGFKQSGEDLVEHIKTHYGTTYVDLVISTHPDADHSSGLLVVLEKLTVGQLAMHRPWEHACDIKALFNDGRITTSGLEERFEKSLQYASDLEALAKIKGIPIVEPFQGIFGFNGAVHILGPSQDYYESLLPEILKGSSRPGGSLGILAPIQKTAQNIINRINDFWHIDLLDDDTDTTSPANNTSTVVLFNLDGHKLLFTGDAGKTALHNSVDYAESQGIILNDLALLDVPHHGSKRNLSSKLLKRIKARTAYVSAAKDSPKHPAKKVTNALKKHGTKVYVTRGKGLLYPNNSPPRDGWSTANEEPFHDFVEE